MKDVINSFEKKDPDRFIKQPEPAQPQAQLPA
jgi:hypothetical protein